LGLKPRSYVRETHYFYKEGDYTKYRRKVVGEEDLENSVTDDEMYEAMISSRFTSNSEDQAEALRVFYMMLTNVSSRVGGVRNAASQEMRSELAKQQSAVYNARRAFGQQTIEKVTFSYVCEKQNLSLIAFRIPML
jgi:uncharacterized protein YycO